MADFIAFCCLLGVGAAHTVTCVQRTTLELQSCCVELNDQRNAVAFASKRVKAQKSGYIDVLDGRVFVVFPLPQCSRATMQPQQQPHDRSSIGKPIEQPCSRPFSLLNTSLRGHVGEDDSLLT